MSIAEDIKVLEEALDAFNWQSLPYAAAGSAWRFAAEPARIKRLVDYVGVLQQTIQQQPAVVDARVAINAQRRKADVAEAKLTRALELLKDAEDFVPKPNSTDIAAFLKEVSGE